LVYFMVLWSILRPFENFCGHLVNFIVIWWIFSRFGMFYQEKSGNPATQSDTPPCRGSHPSADLNVLSNQFSVITFRLNLFQRLEVLCLILVSFRCLIYPGWPDWANVRPMSDD
jgi:hypothetical protein